MKRKPNQMDLVKLMRLFEKAKESLSESTSKHTKEVCAFTKYITSSPWGLYSYSPGHSSTILENIEEASLDEVRWVLTCYARAERFCDGAWMTSLRAGTIDPAIERLVVIYSSP